MRFAGGRLAFSYRTQHCGCIELAACFQNTTAWTVYVFISIEMCIPLHELPTIKSSNILSSTLFAIHFQHLQIHALHNNLPTWYRQFSIFISHWAALYWLCLDLQNIIMSCCSGEGCVLQYYFLVLYFLCVMLNNSFRFIQGFKMESLRKRLHCFVFLYVFASWLNLNVQGKKSTKRKEPPVIPTLETPKLFSTSFKVPKLKSSVRVWDDRWLLSEIC